MTPAGSPISHERKCLPASTRRIGKKDWQPATPTAEKQLGAYTIYLYDYLTTPTDMIVYTY
jgi:hypothetical protein